LILSHKEGLKITL